LRSVSRAAAGKFRTHGNEPLGYIKKVTDDGRLKRVFVVHGELAASQALATGIRSPGVPEVLIPERMQEVEV